MMQKPKDAKREDVAALALRMQKTHIEEIRRLRVSVDILRSSLYVARDTLQNILDWEGDAYRECTERIINQALLIVDATIEGAEDV